MPIGYRGIGELGYLSELFAQGFNPSMLAILLARSPAPLIPEAADFSAKELVELWARMYSQDLLEYDHFLPHIASVSTLKWPVSLTEVSFKLDVLKSNLCVCISQRSSMMMNTLHSCSLVFSSRISPGCKMQVLYNISTIVQIPYIPESSSFLQLRCSAWQILEKLHAL